MPRFFFPQQLCAFRFLRYTYEWTWYKVTRKGSRQVLRIEVIRYPPTGFEWDPWQQEETGLQCLTDDPANPIMPWLKHAPLDLFPFWQVSCRILERQTLRTNWPFKIIYVIDSLDGKIPRTACSRKVHRALQCFSHHLVYTMTNTTFQNKNKEGCVNSANLHVNAFFTGRMPPCKCFHAAKWLWCTHKLRQDSNSKFRG